MRKLSWIAGIASMFTLLALLFAGVTSMRAEQGGEAPLSAAQIDQLVAPIALYPDSLLAQVLMAATYPLEVVEAARWSKEHAGVTGQALEDAMQKQTWDPSVKALTAVPQVLLMMSDQISWTQELGDAFLAQQDEVLDAVQRLRASAAAAGNLQSTKEQTVTTAKRPASAPQTAGAPATVYTIEPAVPGEYFVPIYNPSVVFGTWPYPAYQPFFWYPPGYVASNAFSFASGVAVGAAIWGNVNWWNHRVDVNVNQYNRFNHTNIVNNTWTHNTSNRRGVPYRDPRVRDRFGDRGRDAARDKARKTLGDKGKGGIGQGKGGKSKGDIAKGKGGKGTGGMGTGGKGTDGKKGTAGMGTAGMGTGGMGTGGMGAGGMAAGGMGAGGMGVGGMARGGGRAVPKTGMGGMRSGGMGGGMARGMGGGMGRGMR